MDPVGLGAVLPSRRAPTAGWSAGLCVPALCALLPSMAFLLPGSACALLWVKVSQIFIVETDLSKCIYLHWGSFTCTGAVLSACLVHDALVASWSIVGLCRFFFFFFFYLVGFLFYILPPNSDMRRALMAVLEHPCLI